MPSLVIDGGPRPRLVIRGGPAVVVDHVAQVVSPDGDVSPIPVEHASAGDDGCVLRGRAGSFTAESRWRIDGGVVVVDLDVLHQSDAGVDAGIRVMLDLPGLATQPRWLVPGCFYHDNRPAGCLRIYPRAVTSGGDLALLESPWWSFRSDRAAVPAVFGWTDVACVGLATAPESALGMHGMGFAMDQIPAHRLAGARPHPDGQAARIWLDFPYREEPVTYVGRPEPEPPDVRWHHWRPGERQRVTYWLCVADPLPHAYDPLIRYLYARDRQQHPTAPWMTPAQAAALTAHGLHRWHWRPEHDVLYETAAFDRAHPFLDRPKMHVGWVSGTPWAHALLAYGRRTDREPYVEAARRVLDKISGARTPAGTLWGMWTLERGWACGWNPNIDWLHARTLAEATLFLIRAAALERRHRSEHPAWIASVRDNLRFVADRQDATGDLGAYYHQATGAVVDRQSAAGILWIAALVEGAELLEEPGLLATARHAGDHYARFVDEAFINGAAEDVHLAPTSEDANNALIAYLCLYEADGDRRWLRLAAHAAGWMMTFRYTYNVAFDPHTLLGHYDFRTRGADQASPSNQHLGSYGLICLSELVRLWRYTGDAYYLERARDNLDCFLQFIARADGDFNAAKGMVSERYYQTNCFEAKGSLLTLSHAWCVGVALHGCLVAIDDPEAFPQHRSPSLTQTEVTHG
jgi:hypothetical protein